MKGYLFGLGAMLVGAGLMFVLMHGEVRADDKDWSKSDFLCHEQSRALWTPAYRSYKGEDIPAKYDRPYGHRGHILECKKGNTTCYIVYGDEGRGGISCFKEGLFKCSQPNL